MQFSLTPQTLAQMENVPLQYTGRALDSLDRMGEADQMSLADLANMNEHNAAMRPMLQTQQGLQNASLATRIPGEAADAEMRIRKNSNEAALNPEALESMRSKYGDEKLTHHINQLTGTGSLMMAAAAEVAAAPLGGHMSARQMFDKAGLGSKWHPEWDSLPPDQLAQRLNQAGQELVMTGSKAQSLMQNAQLKGQMQLERTRMEQENKYRIAAMQDQTKRDLAQSMLQWKTSFNKQSTDQYIASLTMRMNAETDPALKQEYNAQIRYLQGVLERIKTQPGATFAVDSTGNIGLVNKKDETGGGAGAAQPRRAAGTAEDPIVLK